MLRQCETCPWKVGNDPHDIPHGYCPEMHCDLSTTIAEPGAIDLLFVGGLCVMACHYSRPGREHLCVGWLSNQLGSGNNLPLRLAVIQGVINGEFETVGEQHDRFEDTLPC